MTSGTAELDTVLAAQDLQQRRVLDRPLVLWDTDPRRGRLVVACCRRAAAAGTRVGMPIAGASELTQPKRSQEPFLQSTRRAGSRKKDPDPFLPIVLQHDGWLDRVALEKIATDLQTQISPLVAIEPLDDQRWAGRSLHQPQALLCDVTGIAHLFGGEQGLIRATQTRLDEFGCIGRIAIADNAQRLGHWHITRLSHAIIPVANRLKPSSRRREAVSDHVAPLNVKALRIPPATVSTLHRLGVQQISQLLALPRRGLATRLGETLIRRLSEVMGEVEMPLQVHRAEAEDIHSLELEYPTGDEKILADRMERLMEKARTGLATRQRGALRITCRLALSGLPPLTFEVGLFAPTLDVDHLTRSACQLDRSEIVTSAGDTHHCRGHIECSNAKFTNFTVRPRIATVNEYSR